MMRRKLPYILLGGALLSTVLVWFLLLVPARAALKREVSYCLNPVFSMVDERIYPAEDTGPAALASNPDQATLRLVRRVLDNRADACQEELLAQDRKLGAWFPELGSLGPRDLPKTDQFLQKYKFQQDELRRRLLALVGRLPDMAGLKTQVPVPALHESLFEKEGRDPSLKELAPAQRIFNIQARLLLAAARAGALPDGPLIFFSSWRKVRRRGKRFTQDKLVLHLRLPSARLAQVLHALVSLEGQGPVCRMTGLKTAPLPLPKKIPEGWVPPIQAQVQMLLTSLKAP